MINHPLLDSNEQNVPSSKVFEDKGKFHGSWSKNQKHAYRNILSGVKKANFENKRLRFLTLTSADPIAINKPGDFDGYKDELRLLRDFQVLRKRCMRKLNFKPEYAAVRTAEGNGVIHALFIGGFIPFNWLQENWEDIHGARMVNIQELSGDPCGIARYIVSQHLAGQFGYVRSSMSWKWVYHGFVRDWKRIVSMYAEDKGMVYCIKIWDRWLMNSLMPDNRHLIEKSLREKAKKKKGSKYFYDYRMLWLGS